MRTPKDTSKYYVTYRVETHPEGLTKEQVKEMDPPAGGTHDFLLFSMIHTADGGLSVMPVSRSHSGGALTPMEIFTAICVLMPSLVPQLPENSWQRFAAQTFVDFVRKVMLAGRIPPAEG